MAKVIEIGIGVDSKAAQQGIQTGLIKPLDDAQKSLTELADSRGPDQLERDLKNAAEASEKLERETTQTAESIEQEYRRAAAEIRRAAQSADTDISGTSINAKEGMQEIKTEALQNASETFSSFDGSAASFADGIQGTFGGLIASIGPLLGPAGLIAAVAGAAGIGLITSSLELSTEQQAELNARISEMTAEFIEVGRKGPAAVEKTVERLKAMVETTEDGKNELRDLYEDAQTAGVDSFAKYAQAVAGAGINIDELIAKQKAEAAQLDELAAAQLLNNDEASYGSYMRLNALTEIIAKLEETKRVTDDAAAAEQIWIESGTALLEARSQVLSTVNDEYDTAASNVEDFLDKETGTLDVDAYLTAMKKRENALKDYQTALALVDLTPETKTWLDSQGAEAASAFLEGYRNATPEKQAELRRIWEEAAQEDSGAYEAAIDRAFGINALTAPTVKYTPARDARLYHDDAQAYLDRNPLKVQVTMVDTVGRPIP